MKTNQPKRGPSIVVLVVVIAIVGVGSYLALTSTSGDDDITSDIEIVPDTGTLECRSAEDCADDVQAFPQCNNYDSESGELCGVISKFSSEYKERKQLVCFWNKPCTKPVVECINNKCIASGDPGGVYR